VLTITALTGKAGADVKKFDITLEESFKTSEENSF
jgi:hypothetical protein